MRKFLWVIGFVILLFIIIGTTFVAYRSFVEPEKYIISSNNSNFSIQKAYPDAFTYYLNEWRVFGSNGITNSIPPGKHTVKTVAIDLTNDIQRSYSISAKGKDRDILIGAGSYVKGDTLEIRVYISKDARVFSDEVLNKNVIFVVMSAIFDATGSSSNDDTLIAAIDAFYKDPNIRPFIVKAK